MRLRGRAVVCGLSALAIAVALAGCWSALEWGESSPPLTEASVIGTWVADGPDGQDAIVVIDANHFVQVTGMPQEVIEISFSTKVDWSETFDGQANWQLGSSGEASSVSVSGEFAFGMISVRNDAGQHLAVYIGDPDSRVRIFFDRVEDP
jgi:hypothetical protein